MKYIALLLITVIMISGCTQEEKPVTEISIKGHGSQIYTFSNDIRIADYFQVEKEEEIKNFFDTNNEINVVFDGSNQIDNSYFTVIVTNLNKIPVFYSYEGRLIGFRPVYFIEDVWYDPEGNNITTPANVAPALWLIGPNTGAVKNSLTIENDVVYLEGTNYNNLTLLADKLSLITMGLSGKIY